MDSEKLLKAMEYIDEDLLLEADEPAKNNNNFIRILLVAAACILVCIVLFASMNSQYRGKHYDTDVKMVSATEETNETDDKKIAEAETTLEPTEEPELNVGNEIRKEASDVDKVLVSASEIPEFTPQVQQTAAPVVMTTPEPEAEKDKENEDFNEKEEATPVPVEPTVTPEPQVEEDVIWTETFAATDVRHSYGIDKTEAVYFVEQLYLSDSGATVPSDESEGEWWYGVRIEDTMYIQAKVQVKNINVENMISETVLKGVSKTDYISKETVAYAYKIKGVSENAAVAVSIDEQSGYFLFINTEYSASTLQEFVSAYNLKEYVKVKALAVYENWDKEVNENPDGELIWDILLSGDGTAINHNMLYFDYDVSATIEVDVKMYGFIDVPIALYDEGYVMIYLGDIYGAYYVGAENVEEIKSLMNVS